MPEAPGLAAFTGAHTAQKVALHVTAAFVLAGLAWVLLTDVILYQVARDSALVARVETAKGWAFVAVAGLLLYLVTLRSARDLARAEALVVAVVESIGDGLLLLGRDRAIAHANPAALRMLGISRDDLVGMDAAEFSRRFRVSYPDGRLVPPDEFVSQLAFDEPGPLRYKAVLYPHEAAAVVVTAAGAPVRTELNQPAVCVVSVLHDITAAEDLDRMRDQFFAAAAHSLKTPVAIIKAGAQTLVRQLPQDERSVAASLERQSERIDRLVQNLFVLSRARSRTLQLHPVAVDLEPLVARIAREGVWSGRHEVRVSVTGEPRVRADRDRLALAMRNALYEASRLAEQGTPLDLEARQEEDRVVFAIRYVPLPWHDHASALYSEYDDVGIARGVASAVAEAHGGSMGEEVDGSRAVLWLELPAEPEPPARPAA